MSDALGASHHAGGAPDVRRGAVTRSDQDLDGAVLSGLDVLGEVLVLDNKDEMSRTRRVALVLLLIPTHSHCDFNSQ